jgi:hypothetical protein
MFEYNEQGDCLSQTVNNVTTSYTLDLATGLTQVLAVGTNNYLYGVERIGEIQPGGWQYQLGDALGSVRPECGCEAMPLRTARLVENVLKA